MKLWSDIIWKLLVENNAETLVEKGKTSNMCLYTDWFNDIAQYVRRFLGWSENVSNFFRLTAISLSEIRRVHIEVAFITVTRGFYEMETFCFSIICELICIFTMTKKRKKIILFVAIFNYHFKLLPFECFLFVWSKPVSTLNVCLYVHNINRLSKCPPSIWTQGS